EHRVFRRVGGVEMMAVDVRVIAATNVDLRARIAEGRFREDLYYRLRVIPIHLPPLDQRGDDLIELADLFLSHFNEIHGKGFRGFSAPAKKKIRSHRWRGNVRELRNTLERAVTLEEGEWIEPDMLHFELDSPDGHGRLASDVAATDGGSLKALERKMLVSALEETSWNQVRAAEKLGIGRDALRYRMRKYGLL
ncbi:MAG: sigma 54-interacting transcriptional regulator, partial [Myxococcota bacterium]